MSMSASCLNWWYMLGSFFLMCSARVREPLLDPGDVEEDAAVRAAAPLRHLAHDAARDVVARQQLGRAAGVLVALGVAPALLFVVGGLAAVVLRDVVEHEPPALVVAQHAALAAHALRHQDAAHARRPDHARGMELHELHVLQLGAGVVGERVAVAGVLPAVAGDLEGPADAAGGQHDRPCAEQPEPAPLAIVAERAGDAVAVLSRRRTVHSMCTSMPWWMPWSCSVRIISRPVRSPTCARRGYRWPPKLRWRMRPSAVRSNSAPHASSSRTRSGASLRVQLGHAPVVDVLAAAHRVGEVHPPAVAVVHVGQRGRDAALGHHGVRLAQQRLADRPTVTPAPDAAIAARSPAPPAPMTRTSCSKVWYSVREILQSVQMPIEQSRT